MRPNLAKQRLRRGETLVNGWCAIPSAFAAETMAHQGWDLLTVDLQHGLVDYQVATTMLQAISTTAATPMVRVPWLEPGIIMKVLDAGAYGIICPMINTAEQARRLVECCLYPPRGTRSFGPVRALLYGGQDYFDGANDELLILAMIETREGLDNLEAIAAVEGLSGLYVGPSDLSISLGFPPGFDRTEPAMVADIGRIAAVARAHGLIAGLHCGTPAYGRRAAAEQGFGLITLSSDARMIAAQSRALLTEMRT
jgi:4-hydroxy-2-oxoheptanedioate aldolase